MILYRSRVRQEFLWTEKKVATVAQSVERRIGSVEVTGPIPSDSQTLFARAFSLSKMPGTNRAKFPSAAVTVID